MKTCIACGMPMTKAADYPQNDESKEYCLYCARSDGFMQSYEEKLEGMTDFMIRTQGMDREAACQMAERSLAKLPAWKNREQSHE
ncbi:MAG: zinc ribbon domain-containing protein [Eubacteriales bacterium]|nr:zinc ribbon domain-containing protein [Eubacteriales bacterium]